MILLIDNYDSFTYNLSQGMAALGADILVKRNDQITTEEIARLHPDKIVISPGPGTPHDAGISLQTIARFGATIPVLGVCLGHQCIGEAFGGRVVRAPAPHHGKTSDVYRSDDSGVLKGLKNPFQAGRYHSLVVERDSLPEDLEVTCETADGLIMGLRHRRFPVEGVQFHPESILTPEGSLILKNFLEMEV
ncbi:MAG TPA: aminodeoxychorismate/anthranilate synthase component II [Chloroflexota bacterium]